MLIDLVSPRKFIDGIPFIYDTSRLKWISEQEFNTTFRILRTGFISGHRFIFYNDTPSNILGHVFDKDSVIKTINIFTENSATFDVVIYINDSEIQTVKLTSENEKTTSLDISVNAFDDLSCKFLSSEQLKNIHVSFLYSYLTT